MRVTTEKRKRNTKQYVPFYLNTVIRQLNFRIVLVVIYIRLIKYNEGYSLKKNQQQIL